MSKITYELDSDSDSTIIDVEINHNRNDSLNKTSTSKNTFSNCFSDVNYTQYNSELESILQKYGVSSGDSKPQTKPPVKAAFTGDTDTLDLCFDEDTPLVRDTTDTSNLHKDSSLYKASFDSDSTLGISSDDERSPLHISKSANELWDSYSLPSFQKEDQAKSDSVSSDLSSDEESQPLRSSASVTNDKEIQQSGLLSPSFQKEKQRKIFSANDICDELISSDEDSPPFYTSACVEEEHMDTSWCFEGYEKTLATETNETTPLTQHPTTSRKRKHGENTNNLDKEKRKQEKAEQRAQKQEEIAKAKRLKQVLQSVNKNMKPEESIKFVTVKIGNEIVKEKYGQEILNALRLMDAKCNVEEHLIPNIITWSRDVLSVSTNDQNDVIEKLETVHVDDSLIIMNWDETINLIHNNTLNTHVQSIKSVINKKKLFIVIYGLDSYFRCHKREKHREVRKEVSQTVSKKTNKNERVYIDMPKVTKKQLESAFTELQILHSCCYRLIESPPDLGMLVTQFTKSIASAPYKLEKYKKEMQASWYMAGDNKDCVKVDKNGNGLKRLWQQQLTTFPLARLEHAEAIITKFPTLKSLLEEYERSTHTDGEKLLQDIPIRRAAGPMTSFRRLGIELSKKVYKFFSSVNGDMVL
uniref:ERCC4 domain-containing protein n=1 Tax=Photinus pyralis TaxID=7054 RepID=A0A1Y1LUS3_PHOPY